MSFSKVVIGLVAVLFLALTLATPASAADRRVRIVNNTNFTIMEFYGSNVGSDSWEEDILGYDVIGPYSSMMINFNDGSGYCMFDFKAVFDDSDVLIRKKINVCEVETYTYN